MRLERDEHILDHVGLYRLSVRPVMSRLFFEGRSSGNVIQRLLSRGRLVARSGACDPYTCYQLSLAEARARGLPLARARPFRAQAIQTHLGVLMFCCGPGRARQRLDRGALRRLFGDRAPKGPHCAQPGDAPVLFRVHVLGPKTDNALLVKKLRGRAERLHRDPLFGPWVEARKYSFALIVATEGRRAALEETISRHDLAHRIQVVVELGAPWPFTVDLRAPKHPPRDADGPAQRSR